MPRIVDKEEIKKQIITSALNAFLKYGFHKTTMNQISQEANIAKGKLYLYFKSKDILISDITSLHFKNMLDKLIPKKYFQTLDELILHIKDVLLISEVESKFIPIFFEVFGSQFSSEAFMEDYRNLFDKIGLFYSENFKILLENKQISEKINPDTLGRVLISMIDGIILHKGFFKIKEKNYSIMVDDAINLFRVGLCR